MSARFFGQFLLERGKIIREELLDAVEFQKTINVKLGIIALDAGYLTADQIEKIHAEQQRTDKLFGELAIEFGFLKLEELEDLLLIQKNERISLGDALIQKGYLTMSSLEEELKIYKSSKQNITESVYQKISQLKSHKIPEVFLDLTIKLLRRLTDIEVDVLDVTSTSSSMAPHIWNTYQEFSGDTNGMFILSFDDKTLLNIASGIAQEQLRDIDEFAKDGVKEFVNTLVGHSAAKFSQDNIKIELRPPGIFTSLSNITLNPISTETCSVKLSSLELETELMLSVVYSPVEG